YLSHIANESVNIDGGDMIEVTGTGTVGDPYVVSIAEGVANSMLITNASGDLEWATIADIVQANETVTTLVNNNDGTYTYTNRSEERRAGKEPTAVIKKYEEKKSNTNVLNELIENLTNNTIGVKVSYDGDQYTYVDTNVGI